MPYHAPHILTTSNIVCHTDGRVCLSIINAPPEGAWKPTISVKEILLGIRDLLDDPNNNDPANAEAFHSYRDKRAQYNKRVKQQAIQFAET